jgi:hypothetical protein
MSGPHRNPDRINTIGVVVVGICGAVLVYVTIVALEAFYVNDTSEIQTMADYGGQDTTAKSVRAEQQGHINEYAPNNAVAGSPQTYRIKIDDAMKLVVDGAKVDPSQLIPSLGRSDISTIKPVFGRPKIEVPPATPAPGGATPPADGAAPPAGAGAAPAAGGGSAAPAPGAPSAELCQPKECGPKLGMPNRKCPDGSTAGPTDRCLRHLVDGKCGWEVLQCPPAVKQPPTAPTTPTGSANPKVEPSPVPGAGPVTPPGGKQPAKPPVTPKPPQPTGGSGAGGHAP